jgi:hypothetical protein
LKGGGTMTRLFDADEFFKNYPELDIEPYNNAPTVTPCDDCIELECENHGVVCPHYKTLEERPHGEREFIEILAQNVPEDLCTYPEYKGKPYYSIHYRENGEDFVGFGTYNPEVLSRFLRDYFMKGGADNETN